MPDDPSRTLVFHPSARSVVYFGSFRFDLADGMLSREGVEIPLPPRALAILRYLVERAGRVVSKQALMDAAWKDAHVSETSLTEAIGLIRQALGDDSHRATYVQTVHRRGYRFVAPIATEEPGLAAAAPDALREIDPSTRAVGTGPAAGTAPARRHSRWMFAAIALGFAALIAIGTTTWIALRPSSEGQVVRVSLALAPEQAPQPEPNAHPVITISPDGERIVYAGGAPENTRLFLRHMDRFEAIPLSGTEGAHGPFFSPDGNWVAFFAGGRLKKVRVSGGDDRVPQVICATPTGVGGTWVSNEEIVFTPDWTGPLMRVSAAGGEPAIVATPKSGRSYRWPDRLDDRTVIATRWQSSGDDAAVVAISLPSGAEQVIAPRATFGRYLAAGYVAFLRDGDVYAVPFDASDRQRRHAPARVLPGVLTGMTGAAQFAVSPRGSLLYVAEAPERSRRVFARVDARGQSEDLPITPRAFRNFAVCDGRIAATVFDRGRTNLWVGHLDRAALTRLTNHGSTFEPVWSPDCRDVTFGWNRTGVSNMYSVQVDSGAGPRLLFASSLSETPGSWSRDGRWLSYVEVNAQSASDVWLWDRQTGKGRPVVTEPGHQVLPRLSPDAARVAYETAVGEGFEIEVADVRTGARVQVSEGGGIWPAWSADGSQLFFLHNGTIQRVTFRGLPEESALIPTDPVPVFSQPDMVLFRPAGEHFVWLRRTSEALPVTSLNLVLNWHAELDRVFR